MDCLGFSIYTAAAIAGGLAVAIVMYGLADQLIKILAAI